MYVIGKIRLVKKMISVEAQDRYTKYLEVKTRFLFWTERLFLFMLLVFSCRLYSLLFGCVLVYSTPVAFYTRWLCRKHSSAERVITTVPIWLFLLDRFMFLVALGAHEAVFPWRLAVIISLVVHYLYKIEYFDRSYKNIHHAELRDIIEEVDVSKEVEKTKDLLGNMKQDGTKMDLDMEFIDHLIYSDLETHRTNLSVKLLELSKELNNVGGKLKTYKELMKSFVNSKPTLRSNVHEDIKASREVTYVADQVHEAYFAIQETAKAAKSTSDKAYIAHLFAQEVYADIQKKRWVVKLEDLEGFQELREDVSRLSLEFAARRMEAKVAADRAAEELSNATVMLMETVGIQPWEECKID